MSVKITPSFKATLPTKNDIKQYVLAKLGGQIDMNNIKQLMEYTGLSSKKLIYIREHYDQLAEQLKLEQKSK